jgi:nucleotide-binding universal stress UspA family protein
MRRFKKILVVASTGADAVPALERAIALAKRNKAQVKVYDVLDALPRGEKKLYKNVGRRKLERKLVRMRLEELLAIVAGVDSKGIRVRVAVGIGTRFVEIIREVLRNGHDLMMKPLVDDEHSRPGGFGSTDLHLMRECPCAVWIMKPVHPEAGGRILAAVDPDPSDEEQSRLDDSVMELATSLAENEESELHVVHSWTLYNEGLLRLLVGNLEKLEKDTRKVHRRRLNALLTGFPRAKEKGRIHLLKGPPRETIPRLARDKGVALIVMGTAARSGVSQFLIGNTAEDVLNQVDCSVLMVKPRRFVSPIALDAKR